MISLLLAAAWAAIPAPASPGDPADAEEAARSARAAFLEGRAEDAAASWRYLSQLASERHSPEANLALALRDAGRLEESLPQWIKATLLPAADGFSWNQRAWAALALGRRAEAAEAFARALDRSSTSASQAESGLGQGLAYLLDAKPRASAEPLRRASTAGPYALSAASRLAAEAALKAGDRQVALTLLRQSLETDPLHYDALRDLARLLDEIGDNRSAWRAAKRLLELDPSDSWARGRLERNSRFVVGDADAAAGVRRIGRPVLDAAGGLPPPRFARLVRVGLYGAPDGRPATLERAYVMANAPFRATSVGHGVLRDDGKAYDQWEIEFRRETNQVEVRDASRRILFASKSPFRLSPDQPNGSVLIKSARPADQVGVDPGDREVRGELEVLPNPWGFKLVQSAPLEHYLYGVVAQALPPGSPPQAYRAQAVVARTAALWAMETRAPNPENFDLLDDDSVQRTSGVSAEMRAASEAVADTDGVALVRGRTVARVAQHEDSGGATENGAEAGEPGLEHLLSVSDAARPVAAWSDPAELERFVHEAPPEGLYGEAAGLAPASSRWIRIIDARELRRRAEARGGELGALRAVRVIGRTSTGRVKALELEGASGKRVLTGFAEIEAVLSPRSLRSTLFVIQPLLDGRRLDRLVLWGAGTGRGLGFSRAGAIGQAALGTSWRDILRRYFPDLEPADIGRPAAGPGAAAPAGAGKTRPKNFRLKPSGPPRAK